MLLLKKVFIVLKIKDNIYLHINESLIVAFLCSMYIILEKSGNLLIPETFIKHIFTPYIFLGYNK